MNITAADLVGVSAHIGHKRHKTHAKARKNLYKYDTGIAIIDSFVTARQATEAAEYLKNAGLQGKTLMVVATKKVAKDIVKKTCQEIGAFYLTSKWVAGTLTNFGEISKNLKKIMTMEEDKTQTKYKDLPKHEQMYLDKEHGKLKRGYDGIVNMKKIPDLIFVVDAHREKNVILEARKLHIPVVAIVDTNASPEFIDFPIVANDDSVSSVEYLVTNVLGAYKFLAPKEIKVEEAKAE